MPEERSLEEPVSSVLDRALEEGRRLRCQEIEAFASTKKIQCVTAEQSAVTAASSLRENVLFVRVVEGRRIGIAFSSSYDRDRVAQCVRNARGLASVSEKDDKWPGFARGCSKYHKVQGLFSKRVESLTPGDQRDMLESMINGAVKTAKGIVVNIAGIEAYQRAVGIRNSNGTDAISKETLVNAYLWTVMGRGESVTPDCANVGNSRDTDIALESVGEMSALIAESSSTLKKPRTEECSVVFSPMALGYSDMGLLSTMMARSLSGERVLRKNSFLHDRMGERVFSRKLTLFDDPLSPGLSGSRQFDDEGCPAHTTPLITEGVVKGCLWDNYYGSMSAKGSTGNATRDRSTGSISVSPASLQVRLGRGDMDKIVSGIDHGYFLWGCQGVHTSNFETGNFSFVASPGLLIEKGELVGGVRGAMLSGNILEMLNNIDAVGTDTQDVGGANFPTMSFSNVKVTTG